MRQLECEIEAAVVVAAAFDSLHRRGWRAWGVSEPVALAQLGRFTREVTKAAHQTFELPVVDGVVFFGAIPQSEAKPDVAALIASAALRHVVYLAHGRPESQDVQLSYTRRRAIRRPGGPAW